jgi:hypothetical protein
MTLRSSNTTRNFMYSSRSARGTFCSNWPHAEREEYVLFEPLKHRATARGRPVRLPFYPA